MKMETEENNVLYASQARVNFVEKKVDEDRQLFTDCIDMHEDQLNELQAQIIKLQNQIPNLRAVKETEGLNYRRNHKNIDVIHLDTIEMYREAVENLPHVPVIFLEVDSRTSNVFQNARIETIGNLKNWSRKDLLRVKNCGVKTVDQIEEALSEFNFGLRKEDEKD